MRIRRGFLNWGAFLICLGAVPLAVRAGALDSAAAAELLRLWPLILVAIGAGLLLRFTIFDAVGGMIVAGTFGVLLGVVVAGGFSGAAATCNAGSAVGTERVNRTGSFAGGAASLSMDVNCADIEIVRAPGGNWTVDGAADSPPVVQADASALRLESPPRMVMLPFGGGGREEWRVTLPAEPALSANLTLNAATAQLGLGSGPLANLNATFNASDALIDVADVPVDEGPIQATIALNASTVRLALPAAVSTRGTLSLNAASLTLCVPEGVGISVQYQDTLSSANFAAAGLVQTEHTWRTPDFEASLTRADLMVTANVSTITLIRNGGCQ